MAEVAACFRIEQHDRKFLLEIVLSVVYSFLRRNQGVECDKVMIAFSIHSGALAQ